jgi:PilZ domain
VVEQRRSKRFDVKLPVKLVRNGLRPITGGGETKNLSSGGVLFASDTRIDIGEPVEYVIGLQPSGEVNLHCLGKVMRLDSRPPNGSEPATPFNLAVTLERYEFIRNAGMAAKRG